MSIAISFQTKRMRRKTKSLIFAGLVAGIAIYLLNRQRKTIKRHRYNRAYREKVIQQAKKHGHGDFVL